MTRDEMGLKLQGMGTNWNGLGDDPAAWEKYFAGQGGAPGASVPATGSAPAAGGAVPGVAGDVAGGGASSASGVSPSLDGITGAMGGVPEPGSNTLGTANGSLRLLGQSRPPMSMLVLNRKAY